MARIFEEAGLQAGVLQMLPGGADVGEALVTDPAVNVISYTGSTNVGRRIGELAGEHLKRAHLELGGNSAVLVLDDADVEAARSDLADEGARCFCQGQIVHDDRAAPGSSSSVDDDCVEALADIGLRTSPSETPRRTRWRSGQHGRLPASGSHDHPSEMPTIPSAPTL